MTQNTGSEDRDPVRTMSELADAAQPSPLHLILLAFAFEPLALHFDGRILAANEAFLELIGGSADRVIGESFCDFVELEMLREVSQALLEKNEQPVEAVIRRCDGALRIVRLRSRRIDAAEQRLGVLALSDLTDLRVAEEKLAAWRAMLYVQPGRNRKRLSDPLVLWTG